MTEPIDPARGSRAAASLQTIPTYVWTFLALLVGIVSGGAFSQLLEPVARMTTYLIEVIITVVPILIFAALSPAVATLVKRGLAGRFATTVVLWYMVSSTAAGLYALVVSSLIFKIPFTSETSSAWSEALGMLRVLSEQGSASLPLLAIVGAVLLGAVAVGIPPVYAFLVKIEGGIARVGNRLGYIMLPLILCLGVAIGVRFGARLGMGHYLTMTAYTALLCLGWWLFYVFVVIRYLAKRRPQRLLTAYYVPTALFAAGTCSSLATLPVNLANVKAYGVRDEVADFLLPFGAVANMDGSALAYVAYAPFVLSHIFGIEISWTLLLMAWPAIVLFTTAAPGLPAGIGTALWSSTLFASMLGLDGQLRGEFIATWIALAGGLPDMFRSATNTTGDGFTAVVFDSLFDRFFASDRRTATGLATSL